MECLHLPYPWLYDAVTKTLGDPTVQEDIYHEMVVLGNFPKLPPNFIVRTSTVSYHLVKVNLIHIFILLMHSY